MEFTLGALANDVFWGSKVSLGYKPSIPSYTLESEIRQKVSLVVVVDLLRSPENAETSSTR
jgi:hypothetical protein